MCIDPGLSGTGIAVWVNSYWAKKVAAPSLVYSFVPSGHIDGWKIIYNLLNIWKVSRLYVERSTYYGGKSDKGKVSAESQDLISLTEYIGGIAGIAALKDIQVNLIPAINWKGTLPKSVTEYRVNKVWPQAVNFCNSSHAYDAVGIGFKLMGLIGSQNEDQTSNENVGKRNSNYKTRNIRLAS